MYNVHLRSRLATWLKGSDTLSNLALGKAGITALQKGFPYTDAATCSPYARLNHFASDNPCPSGNSETHVKSSFR